MCGEEGDVLIRDEDVDEEVLMAKLLERGKTVAESVLRMLEKEPVRCRRCLRVRGLEAADASLVAVEPISTSGRLFAPLLLLLLLILSLLETDSETPDLRFTIESTGEVEPATVASSFSVVADRGDASSARLPTLELG